MDAALIDITVNWHNVGFAAMWAILGFDVALAGMVICKEVGERRAYVKALEAR